jgi:two-component sensor histidine kinase/DNA-binding response OmpR family regulator
MAQTDKVNVLLVDDQPAKLLAYEVILKELDENLVKASSARETLDFLLKNEVAVLLIDVCMPELDGFQLADMIRQHPRFAQTAIIFISAIHLTDVDLLRGYSMGAVDYVSVPVVPEVLRAKVRVFAELYRKTRQLEQLNRDLERRVAERTADLEASNARLLESEQRRTLALAAGQMGSWDWAIGSGQCVWDEGQYRIFGVEPDRFDPTFANIRRFIHQQDLAKIEAIVSTAAGPRDTFQIEARIVRPGGQIRWCICAAAMTSDGQGKVQRVSGVTIDITDLKEAEARRTLLIQEVDHRARNALAVVQSIIRLTKADTIGAYVETIEGRIRALSTAHALLSESRWEGADLGRLVDEELAPYRQGELERIAWSGPAVFLQPSSAQIIALVLHELATNAAKYGAMSAPPGRVEVSWQLSENVLTMVWQETNGPRVQAPKAKGYGTKVINASVVQQLGGTINFDWREEGLRFTMTAPIGTVEPTRAVPQKRRKAPNDQIHLAADKRSGSRLLLVEDEALVGMMMKDALTELGFSVIGPFGRVADAMPAASKETFHAAILDINVKGELIYGLADAIAARDIPLVFVTGYGAEAVEERFRAVPVLQKPIDRTALERVLVSKEIGNRRIGEMTAAAGDPNS